MTQRVVAPYLANAVGTKPISILLVDDQEIIGEAVRRLIATESDVVYHYCKDPTEAIKMAEEVRPTVILQDLVMPEIDGLTLVRYFRANPITKNIPLIVLSSNEEPVTKAKAFEYGANDYLVKLPDKVEFLARVRHHSRGYQSLLDRNAAYEKLAESQKQIQEDLSQAAAYVESLLPALLKGPIATSWAYIPSDQLGGDSFGYHWIDNEHFAIYLLDVCGHGVGAALLSITVMNILRSSSMLKASFDKPASVLKALNEEFQMEQHGGRFFTIWYGVYNKTTRKLTYATAGHPPALLRVPGKKSQELKTEGFVIGGFEQATFVESQCEIPPGSVLYVFSDGVFELSNSDGVYQNLPDFMRNLNESQEPLSVEAILKKAHEINRSATFEDDFSIVRVAFQ